MDFGTDPEIFSRNIHYHSDFELTLLLGSGKGNFFLNGSSLPLHQNEMYILNPLDTHGFSSSQPNRDGLKFLCLQFSPNVFREVFPPNEELRFQASMLNDTDASQRAALQGLFLDLAQAYFSKTQRFSAFEYLGFFNLLIYQLLKTVPHHFLSNSEKQSRKTKVGLLNRIVKYVEKNYMFKVSLSDLATSEGLSSSYLSHFISKNMGCSFQDYVTSIRLEHAKLLLLHGKRPAEASIEAGFSDPRYLLNAFQKHVGCSPSDYQAWSTENRSTKPTRWDQENSERIFTPGEALLALEDFRLCYTLQIVKIPARRSANGGRPENMSFE